MIKHITMITYKDTAEGCSKDENLERSIRLIKTMRQTVSQIKSLEFGLDILHRAIDCDLVTILEFANLDEMHTAVAHPDGQAFTTFIKNVSAGLHSVTYEV